MNHNSIHLYCLLMLLFFISAVFLFMVKSFLMAILLAGIFSVITHPMYNRIKVWLNGKKSMAAGITMLIIIFIILLPLSSFFAIVTTQAIKIGQEATPWIQKQIFSLDLFFQWLENLPFYEDIVPYRDNFLNKIGELIGNISQFIISGIQTATMKTMNFILMIIIMLYTMFFFLMDGKKLLEKILFYLPLRDEDERRLLDKFISVTRATIKGTAIIGIIQGSASGLAFFFVGIKSALFWGTLMSILSIVPGIGTALIWLPAALWLMTQGNWLNAMGLILFCGLIVGSVDNILRPMLVAILRTLFITT